jgi:MoxR-like ATPase
MLTTLKRPTVFSTDSMQPLTDKLKDYENAFSGIIGQIEAKRQIASALLASRNLIIAGPPGIGKTSIAKSVAELLAPDGSAPFVRVQGSPDLTAEDLIGDLDPQIALEKGASAIEAFVPGKIFKASGGVLFFDEINRAPERLQNALLQVLEERIVTVGTYEMDFDVEFVLIGTMNPKDTSTEKLSEVFLDRFDIVEMDYPSSVDEEKRIVDAVASRDHAELTDAMSASIVSFVHELRRRPEVLFGPSVRGTIGVAERSRTHALLSGHTVVTWEDVRAVVGSVLGHRLTLKPSAGFETAASVFVEHRFDVFSEEGFEAGEGVQGFPA